MAIQFDQRSLPIGRIQRRIPAPTRARTKVALVFDDSLFVGERLIERKWRQNSADLCSVPRRHFRSNHVVLGASHSRLRGPGGAGMAAEWSSAWCWRKRWNFVGVALACHEVNNVAKHHTLLDGERPRQGRSNRQPFRSIRRALGTEAARMPKISRPRQTTLISIPAWPAARCGMVCYLAFYDLSLRLRQSMRKLQTCAFDFARAAEACVFDATSNEHLNHF